MTDSAVYLPDPTMHGEISTIRHCTDVLRAKGLTPQQILASWRDFTLYTNGKCTILLSVINAF
jgi:tRNA(Arg) A34 adenosine deaminase TadA